jgi:hypothetical protein
MELARSYFGRNRFFLEEMIDILVILEGSNIPNSKHLL